MKQVLHVEGMSCTHCVSNIEGGLKEKNVNAKVDLAKGTVEVEYEESVITIHAIKEAIEDMGYDVH